VILKFDGMETILTVYNGELRTRAIHLLSGTEIITDAPPDNQGKGESFSPTDLAATALGSCMLTVMGILARNHDLNIDGTSASITKIMGNNPRRIIEIQVVLTFPHDRYSEKERHLLENTARACPVAKSLHPDLMQTITFQYKSTKEK
jgi:putative redox protein